jgi:tRNA threonylcarbamoyladenosine biosynthesis protein TsaE
MSVATITSKSAEETRAIGEALGSLVQIRDMVLLSGELGAGKTVFVQGMATGLGYDGTVSSKSFVLLGEYEGRLKLFHADLYRLDDPEMVEDLALDELVADGVVAVEWPERADSRLPEDGLFVRFTIEADEGRTIALEPRGERAAELATRLIGTVVR